MGGHFILTDYVAAALTRAEYEKLDDGSYSGRIPECVGVLAFGSTLNACQDELRSTLEDWLLLGLKLSHPLPIIDNIDLNQAASNEKFTAELDRATIAYYDSHTPDEAEELAQWGDFAPR